MSALFSRLRIPRRSSAASESMAALISNLEACTGERPTLSPHEFRKFIQEHSESKAEAWIPIRAAARNSGSR
jgi:hypothetical protein